MNQQFDSKYGVHLENISRLKKMILKFYKLKQIQYYNLTRLRKNDILLSKVVPIITQIQNTRHPVFKTTVEDNS